MRVEIYGCLWEGKDQVYSLQQDTGDCVYEGGDLWVSINMLFTWDRLRHDLL